MQKFSFGASFDRNSTALVVVAIDKVGLVRGLWCKRILTVSMLLGEASTAIA